MVKARRLGALAKNREEIGKKSLKERFARLKKILDVL